MDEQNDRELLERAAKAAGYELQPLTVGGSDRLYLPGEMHPWNPLTDDGDALRLAVKLGISIVHRRTFSSDDFVAVAAARWADDYDNTETMYEGDSAAATRRAIVRAAASLPSPTPSHLTPQEREK